MCDALLVAVELVREGDVLVTSRGKRWPLLARPLVTDSGQLVIMLDGGPADGVPVEHGQLVRVAYA